MMKRSDQSEQNIEAQRRKDNYYNKKFQCTRPPPRPFKKERSRLSYLCSLFGQPNFVLLRFLPSTSLYNVMMVLFMMMMMIASITKKIAFACSLSEEEENCSLKNYPPFPIPLTAMLT